MYRIVVSALLGLVFSFSSNAFAGNLLRNGSFEATPCVTPCNQGPYFLPSDWLQLVWLPMTYSNDGSYGLSPTDTDNFIGATAQDGLRWVGAYSGSPEVLGQVLATPLVPGRAYLLTAYIRAATVKIANNPGTYQIELWNTTDRNIVSRLVLGSFDLTSNSKGWDKRSLAFTAPAQAQSYPIIAFRAMGSSQGPAYPGLDNVALVDGGDDADGDGVPDVADECPNSDLGSRVIIGDCETGVPNRMVANGCTLSDQARTCATASRNKGDFVSCIASLANSLQKSDLITGQEKGQLQSCAAQSR